MKGPGRFELKRIPAGGHREARAFPGPGSGSTAPGEGLREVGFVFSLLPILAGMLALAWMGPIEIGRPATLLAFFLASGGWGLAVWLGRKVRDSWAVVTVVLTGALALRLIALASDPGLSDDVFRYVWEGGLLAEGVDPWAHSPDAEALAPYRTRWPATWERVNHRDVPAAYPPLAQVANAAVVELAGGPERSERAVLFLRVFAAACDLLVCWPLLSLLRERGAPRAWLVLWAWSPLVALEFAGSGHGDALAILCLVVALRVLGRAPLEIAPLHREARENLGLSCLVAGTLTKCLPAALLPFALRSLARPWRGLLFALVLLGLGLLPFALLARGLPGRAGLGEYAFRWESFNLVFRWIEGPLERFLERDESWNDPRRVARAIAAAAWLALGCSGWRRRFGLVRAAAALVGGFLVLTPTLHPWYLTWMAPFLCLRPALAWTFLLGAAPLLYWPIPLWRRSEIWEEPGWLWPVLALPFFAFSLLDLVLRRRDRKP